MEKLSNKSKMRCRVRPASASRVHEQVRKFSVMLEETEQRLTYMLKEMRSDSTFRPLFETIVRGENGNAGLREAIKRLDEDHLFSTLRLDDRRRVGEVSGVWFYERFMRPRFIPILNQLAYLYQLTRIKSEYLDPIGLLKRDQINLPNLLFTYTRVVQGIKRQFGLEVRTVALFKEEFDPEKHREEIYSYTTIGMLIPEAIGAVSKLPRGVIYDVVGVGLKSEQLILDTKPTVVYTI